MNTPGLSRLPASARVSDGELVARCCAGDRTAWRALYERYAALVFRFLGALGVRDPEREDACQDVFLAVYRSLPSFRGEAQLSTWIYRITARTTGKLIQKRKLRTLLADTLTSQPPPAASDPTERATRSLLLDRMLDRLNPKKRLVLVLFELEGVPVEEIARIAGCPTNTVWSRLHHARLDLTKIAAREDKRRHQEARRRGKGDEEQLDGEARLPPDGSAGDSGAGDSGAGEEQGGAA